MIRWKLWGSMDQKNKIGSLIEKRRREDQIRNEGEEYLKESRIDLGFSDCYLHGTQTLYTIVFSWIFIFYFIF